jgi:NADH:ubiquinone oxidoreductase subunit 3 (subunit A)
MLAGLVNGATIGFGAVGERHTEVQPVQVLLDNYAAVLLATFIGIILVATALIASRVLAPFSTSREKATSYECGMLPAAEPVRTQLHFRYYLFAILFLIFDVEAVFLFPWAVTFVGVGQAAFYEMVLFILILGGGLAYAWKKGVLQWR